MHALIAGSSLFFWGRNRLLEQRQTTANDDDDDDGTPSCCAGASGPAPKTDPPRDDVTADVDKRPRKSLMMMMMLCLTGGHTLLHCWYPSRPRTYAPVSSYGDRGWPRCLKIEKKERGRASAGNKRISDVWCMNQFQQNKRLTNQQRGSWRACPKAPTIRQRRAHKTRKKERSKQTASDVNVTKTKDLLLPFPL